MATIETKECTCPRFKFLGKVTRATKLGCPVHWPKVNASSVITVTEDKTPVAPATTCAMGNCGACGRPIMSIETCWMAGGHPYCSTEACRPRSQSRGKR